jgi:hypothetical protein
LHEESGHDAISVLCEKDKEYHGENVFRILRKDSQGTIRQAPYEIPGIWSGAPPEMPWRLEEVWRQPTPLDTSQIHIQTKRDGEIIL